jgi:uncharacterized sulfatase
MCEWFDQTCGELLGHLDEKGLAENTLVLFVVDNGWIQLPDAGGYAPRSKRSQYDGGIRSPFILRWPKRIRPRADRTTPVVSIDFAPTILAACGLEPTPAMQGLNLLDPKVVAARPRIFGAIFEHNAVDIRDPATSLQYRWCIEGSWKVIVPRKATVPDGVVELYDVVADPHEKRNRAGEDADRVKRMRAALDAWWPGKPVR